MKKTKNLQKVTIIAIAIGTCIIGAFGAYAINTTSEGYRVGVSETKNITIADTSCKKITNNGTDRFIPTKTMAEWNTFSAAAAGLGVTVASCASCPANMTLISGECYSPLLGPTSFYTAYNNCVSTYGTTILDSLGAPGGAWQSWGPGQVNYASQDAGGGYIGSISCYPAVFPPSDMNSACVSLTGSMNSVFSNFHTFKSTPGVYNGNAYYRCKKLPS